MKKSGSWGGRKLCRGKSERAAKRREKNKARTTVGKKKGLSRGQVTCVNCGNGGKGVSKKKDGSPHRGDVPRQGFGKT